MYIPDKQIYERIDTQDVPKRAATGLEIEFAVGIINYAAVELEIGSRRTGEGEMMFLEVILGMVTGESIFDATCMIEIAHLDEARSNMFNSRKRLMYLRSQQP